MRRVPALDGPAATPRRAPRLRAARSRRPGRRRLSRRAPASHDAEPIDPRLDGVFVFAELGDGERCAPAVVAERRQRDFVPVAVRRWRYFSTPASRSWPSANTSARHETASPTRPLDRKAAAVDLRLQVLDDHARRDPRCRVRRSPSRAPTPRANPASAGDRSGSTARSWPSDGPARAPLDVQHKSASVRPCSG